MSLYAVIIAGGRGKRFWPESRTERPKYLLRLPGQKSTLLQHTVSRLKGLVQSKNIIVVTNKLQYPGVKKQLPQVDKKNIIPEPLSRNTAAAVALAATIINAENPVEYDSPEESSQTVTEWRKTLSPYLDYLKTIVK